MPGGSRSLMTRCEGRGNESVTRSDLSHVVHTFFSPSHHQVPTVVEKAIASEGGGELATRRAMAFGKSFSAHLNKLKVEPGG